MRWIKLAGVALAVTGTALTAQAQTIGPDAFGYRITKAATGTFTSIVGQTGTLRLTPTGAAADDVTYLVNMGFTFPFYGTNYPGNQVFASTNGFIALGGATEINTNQGSYLNPNLANPTITGGGVGAPTIERPVIAPHWDDLYFSGAGTGGLYTQTRTVGGVQEAVFEWNSAPYFDNGNPTTQTVTFQAILRANGTMQFNYPNVAGPITNGGLDDHSNGRSASIGLHDINGGGSVNRYLSWTFNGSPNQINSGDTLDVTLTPVPEPGTLLLTGMAGLGAVVVRRRRRSAA
jgi:hypothetical protein